MDERELLRKNYEDACQAYLKAFCQKHGYDYDDAVSSWDFDGRRGIVSVGDEVVSIDDIIIDIDTEAPKGAYAEWYNYCLRISSISSKLSINTPNYERWLDGCLRKTEENIAALEAGLERVSEAKRMLQEEIVKQEEFDVLWSGIINY